MTNFAVALAVLIGLVAVPSAADSSPGSITIFSDDSCADFVVSQSGTVPLDACIPASTTGDLFNNLHR